MASAPNGLPLLHPSKYEDDISTFQRPDSTGNFVDGYFRYRFDKESALDLIRDTNTPWHPTKTGERFDYYMVFIGFYWDLILRRVSLPENKRLKFLARISVALEKISAHKSFSLLEIQVLHGSLVHIIFIYVDGSSRLPAISHFMSGFNEQEFTRRHASESVRKTLLWWYNRLSDRYAYRQLHPLQPLQDIGIYVDASTSWGIGIIIRERWYAFQLVDNWKVKGRDICWLEAVALELLVYFLIQLRFSEVHLLMHSDNNGAIGAHTKGRSHNVAINLCVRRTYMATAEHLIIPRFIYIASADNPSDPISRGELGLPNLRLTRSFPLPPDLIPYLHDDF